MCEYCKTDMEGKLKMKIEVGEHVKVKEWNVIGKILKITPRKIYIDSLGFGLTREQIDKHSKNIIDLIEVGDYVNKHKVIEVDDFKDWIDIGEEVLREEDIKSIVTHEQFESIEYKVEEDK